MLLSWTFNLVCIDCRINWSTGATFWWKDLLILLDSCKQLAQVSVKNGSTVVFWEDRWNTHVLIHELPQLYSFAKEIYLWVFPCALKGKTVHYISHASLARCIVILSLLFSHTLNLFTEKYGHNISCLKKHWTMQQHQRLGWSAIFSKHNIMKSSSSNICSSIKDDLAQNFYMQSSNKSTTVDLTQRLFVSGWKRLL